MSPDDPTPLPVTRALKKLGRDLALARRRRHLSQESMAERLRVSVATLKRMEQGEARVAVGTIARALHVLGELGKLENLIDTAADEIGLALMDEQLPRRIRKKKVTPESGAV